MVEQPTNTRPTNAALSPGGSHWLFGLRIIIIAVALLVVSVFSFSFSHANLRCRPLHSNKDRFLFRSCGLPEAHPHTRLERTGSMPAKHRAVAREEGRRIEKERERERGHRQRSEKDENINGRRKNG